VLATLYDAFSSAAEMNPDPGKAVVMVVVVVLVAIMLVVVVLFVLFMLSAHPQRINGPLVFFVFWFSWSCVRVWVDNNSYMWCAEGGGEDGEAGEFFFDEAEVRTKQHCPNRPGPNYLNANNLHNPQNRNNPN
jgi:hypothetical protein